MCLVSSDHRNTRMHGFCDRSHLAGAGPAGREGASWGSHLEVGRARASGSRKREVVAAHGSRGPGSTPELEVAFGGGDRGHEARTPGLK